MCSSLGPEDEDHDDDDDEGGVAEEAGLLDDAEVLVSVVGFGAGSLLQPATATIAAMVKTVAARRAPCFMSPPGIKSYDCWLCCSCIQSRTSAVRITHDVPTL